MLSLTKLTTKVFGVQREELSAIPAGPAFVYLWRRYGPPNTGSDEYKELCRYYFQVMPGVQLHVSLNASRAWITPAYGMDVEERYRSERDEYIYKPYSAKREAWAKAHGMTWQEYDVFEVDEETADMCWANNQAITEAYKASPEYEELDLDNPALWGPYMTEIYTAIEAAMRDWLKVVGVRDVRINILGQPSRDDAIWNDVVTDEDGEFDHYVNEVERHPMSGYGYGWAQDFVPSPESYPLYINETRVVRKQLVDAKAKEPRAWE